MRDALKDQLRHLDARLAAHFIKAEIAHFAAQIASIDHVHPHGQKPFAQEARHLDEREGTLQRDMRAPQRLGFKIDDIAEMPFDFLKRTHQFSPM